MTYSDIYYLIVKSLAERISNGSANTSQIDLYIQMTTIFLLTNDYSQALEEVRSILKTL